MFFYVEQIGHNKKMATMLNVNFMVLSVRVSGGIEAAVKLRFFWVIMLFIGFQCNQSNACML